MRDAFINELLTQAASHDDTFLIVGDLGYSVVEPFAEQFRDRFLNAGIAEQNMTGLAAGLAQTGFNVFTYSIANFPTIRCLEQIRNDVCYHGANVKVVSVGAGLAYGSLGYSHHAVQDLACLRSLPGMLMATPCDPLEAQSLVEYLCHHAGPAYLRLGKAKERVVHASRPKITTAPAIMPIREGRGRAILACGSVAELGRNVAAMTGAALYSAALWSMDKTTERAILGFVENYDRVVVVEEHLKSGGFGSFVRECLEPRPDLQVRVRCLSLDEKVCGLVGSQAYLRLHGGLTAEAILRALLASEKAVTLARDAA